MYTKAGRARERERGGGAPTEVETEYSCRIVEIRRLECSTKRPAETGTECSLGSEGHFLKNNLGIQRNVQNTKCVGSIGQF